MNLSTLESKVLEKSLLRDALGDFLTMGNAEIDKDSPAYSRYLNCTRELNDLRAELKGGYLVELTSYGKRLDGKHGITGKLIATLTPHEINSHLNASPTSIVWL